MNKTEIKDSLRKQYFEFSEYINELSYDDFLFTDQLKWSARQHLRHIVLSITPLVQVFGMPKIIIEQKFGAMKNKSRTYDNLLSNYLEKLNKGGKAPSRYVPELVLETEKDSELNSLSILIDKLISEIDVFTENELDTLSIPHPLLGSISLREMLYNAIYHVEHHQKIIKTNLQNEN
jgi:hypothetical protein|nr:DinB family protein [uncultured Psychroserpens sp.]